MQSEKIERLFVEFILKEIGPSEENEKYSSKTTLRKYFIIKLS